MDYRKSETKPAPAPLGAVIGCKSAAEQAVPVFVLDAHARIRHDEVHIAVFLLYHQIDMAYLGKLLGIVEQMAQGTSQPIGIGRDGKVVIDIRREAYLYQRIALVFSRLDQREAEFITLHICLFDVHVLTFALAVRKFKQLVDSRGDDIDVRPDTLLHILLLLIRQMIIGITEYLREAGDGIQRRANLVTHVLDESRLHAV